MKFVSDHLGRFDRRPHYDPWELDDQCEQLVEGFLQECYGRVEYPVSTGDLTLLIERDISDYDSAADLSGLGEGVEGVTDFFMGKKPNVRIAAHLWDGPSRENRLRTTLAHEYGHVRFHNWLYQMEGSRRLYESITAGVALRCKRDDVQGNTRDWMEWQAAYASGALLMPERALRRLISARPGDDPELIIRTAAGFHVSADAARVRLSQLKLLGQ
jgi:hypothetical protein